MGLGQPQAEIDAKQADAVSKLITALKDYPYGAMQVGSILLIKTNGNRPSIQAKTLTQKELIHLENNQDLLASPATLLQRLSEISRGAPSTSISIDGKTRKSEVTGEAEYGDGQYSTGLISNQSVSNLDDDGGTDHGDHPPHRK